jgi:histidinol-phosphate aminotransferase
MSQYWSPFVNQLVPYVPGEQPKMTNLVKLNTNENPYPPSPKVISAMQEAIGDGLRLYPDPNADALKQSIAKHYGLQKSQVFVGNGSDEVLAHAFCAFFQQGKPLLFPDISYSFYPVYCQLYGIEAKTVPLNDAFEIEVADYQGDIAGVIFPNPNAPTGCLLPLTAIETILKNNPQCVVLVDEAYIDFGGKTAASLIKDYPNLLVCQTLSKSRSLAGARVGLALGQDHLIDALERVKNSFNSYPLDKVAQAGAQAAFEDSAYFTNTCQQVIASRETLTHHLKHLGFDVLPSAANFVFAQHPQHDAATLATILREQGVIVRHFKQARIENFLRISIGTEQQNQRLIDVLQQYMQ